MSAALTIAVAEISSTCASRTAQRIGAPRQLNSEGQKVGAARALPPAPLPNLRAAQRRRRLDVDRRVAVISEQQEDLRLNPGGRNAHAEARGG